MSSDRASPVPSSQLAVVNILNAIRDALRGSSLSSRPDESASSTHDCLRESLTRCVAGPITKMMFPDGSLTPNVRAFQT